MSNIIAPRQNPDFSTEFEISGNNIQGINASQIIFPSLRYLANRSGRQCCIQFAGATGALTTSAVNDIIILVNPSPQNWLIDVGMAPPPIRTATPVVVSVAGVNEIAVVVWLSNVVPTFVLRRLNGSLFPIGAIALPEGFTINWII